MANTINFGNGQWATKENSILAYNDENANFKPLPFVTSRASTATTVNKSGLLETVASGVPRVDYLDNSKGSYLLEPSSTNLITQSEAFGNSYWSKSGASIEGDASTAGVDILSGWDFTSGWLTSSATVLDLNSFSTSAPTGYLYRNDLIEIGKTYQIRLAGTVSGTSSVRVLSNTSTLYVPSQTGTFDVTYQFTVSSDNFLLIRGDISNGTFDITALELKEIQGFSAPSVDSPLGAFKLVEDSSTGSHRVYSANVSVTDTLNYTYSCYVKASGRNNIQFYGGARCDISATFDLTTLTTTGGGVIDALTNGWYRLSATGLATGTGATNILTNLLNSSNLQTYTGDGASGIYIFGSQLEQQSYATSYIPTSGSQISRLSESAHLGDLNAKGLINDSAIVLYIENDIQSNTVSSYKDIIALYNNNFNAGFRLETRTDNRVYIQQSGLVTSGENFNTFSLGNNSVNLKKIAVCLTKTQFKVFADGVQVGATLNGAYVLNFDNIGFKINNQTVEAVINSKDLRIYNTSLSDSELQTLTTI